MKASNPIFLSIISGIILSGLTVEYTNAVENPNYYEENITCAITTSSALPVTVTDGVDFNFVDGSDYLIVATSTWGGEDNAHLYEINMVHNSTIFDGSQQIIEPKASNIGCSADHDHYKYFFWTVWSPVGATEASQDISLNYTSLDGSDMLYDDVTIFVMELDALSSTDWYYDEQTETIPIGDQTDAYPEATFVGSEIDGEGVEQPATFFKDNGDPFEDDDGYVDCIRIWDVSLNATTATSLTNSTDTCWSFPDTSIPVPIINFELNGDATDEFGGTDLQVSNATGINATGWVFLEEDDAYVVADEIPNSIYAIEMVLSFDNFTPLDNGTYVFPRVLDWHNNEGAYLGQGDEFGLYLDEIGQDEDNGIWFWDVQPSVEGTAFGGEPMLNNTLTHILFQRNSTGWFEAYKDGELAFAFDDSGPWSSGSSEQQASLTFTPTNNGHDWVIFGSAELAVGDVTSNYETRLNYNDVSFKPLVSKEGEDVAEIHVDTFTRPFNLTNTSHTFKIESSNDNTPVGTNEILHSAILALNLNAFQNHNATWYDNELLVDESNDDFDQEIMTLDIQNYGITNNWFIFSDFTKGDDKKMKMRMQVDDVDSPDGQTVQTYDFGDNWDKDDWQVYGFGTYETLTNLTHTVDVDASGSGKDSDRYVDSRSIWGFSVNQPGNATYVVDLLDVYESESTTLGSGHVVCLDVDLESADTCDGHLIVGHTYRFEVEVDETGGGLGFPSTLDADNSVADYDLFGNVIAAQIIASGCDTNTNWTESVVSTDVRTTSGTICGMSSSTAEYWFVIRIVSDAGSGAQPTATFTIDDGSNTDTSSITTFTVDNILE